MTLEAMVLADDFAKHDYMWSWFGLQSEFYRHKDAIQAGIKAYNDERSGAEGDPGAERAFTAERGQAEAHLKAPKNYAGMKGCVERWPTLLPAINDYYASRRSFEGREAGLDGKAENTAKRAFANTHVADLSPEGDFTAGTKRVRNLMAELAGKLSQRSAASLEKVPEPYRASQALKDLVQGSASEDQKVSAQAHKQIVAWAEALGGYKDAKAALDRFDGGNGLHAAAAAALKRLAPALPGPMESIDAEKGLFQAAKALGTAVPGAEAYTKARKAVDDAWASAKPDGAKKAYDDATGSFDDVEAMGLKTTALEDVAALLRTAGRYEELLKAVKLEADKAGKLAPQGGAGEGGKFALGLKERLDGAGEQAAAGQFAEAVKALEQAQKFVKGQLDAAAKYGTLLDAVNADAGKVGGIEPEAGSGEGKKFASDLKKQLGDARKQATAGLFADAGGTLEAARKLVGDRSREILDGRGARADQAKGGLDPADASIGPEAMKALGLLAGAAPKDRDKALLAGDHPHLRLAELVEPARRYKTLLDAVEANWKTDPIGTLKKPHEEATRLTAPGKADDVQPGFFDAPIKALEAFNRLWQAARDFDAELEVVQASFDALDKLHNGNKGRKGYKDDLKLFADLRKRLGDFKQATFKRVYDAKGLGQLGIEIDAAMSQFSGAALDGAKELAKGDPGAKRIIDALEGVKRADVSVAASLYMALGDKLLGLLKGLDTIDGDADQSKAIAHLTALCDKLGAKGLRQLALEASPNDMEGAGKLLGGVMEKGLAGAAPPPGDDRNANLDRLLAAFPDRADLSKLLGRLAAGKPAEAGPRMAAVLGGYLGHDIGKLNDPFYENLKELPTNELPKMLEAAPGFKRTAPTGADLHVDPATTKGLPCPPERMRHFLNRHTREYCAFKAENFQNPATMWPDGTTAGDIKDYLAKAVAEIDPVPDPNAMASFVQRDATIAAGGRNLAVRVGFERHYDAGTGEYKVKITQFYPKGGNGLSEMSGSQMEFLGRGLFGK